MNKTLEKVLKHLYISPLEGCNLQCKICYTKKTAEILSKEEILDFIKRYQKIQKLETVTFCGGEVFLLPYFPELINELTKQNIIVQIITNGTIDRLREFANPNLINLIVSIDGLEKYHDKNRGKGNFKKSLNFLKQAQELGFHTEIFSIVTKQNLIAINFFEDYLTLELSFPISITYHPRKSPEYLKKHPLNNIAGGVKDFDFLTRKEIIELQKEKRVFPPQGLECYQISLMSDKNIYACCEGIEPIGKIKDNIKALFAKMQEMTANSICPYSDFKCGIKNL